MTEPRKPTSEPTPLQTVWMYALTLGFLFLLLWGWAELTDGPSQGDAAYCEVDEGYMGAQVVTCYGPE
jgi:hypothetical protein